MNYTGIIEMIREGLAEERKIVDELAYKRGVQDTLDALDDLQDVIIVVMILVQDMWDNRTLYVDESGVNKVVESILGLHSVNLL